MSNHQATSLSDTKRKLLQGYRRGLLANLSERQISISARPKGSPTPLSWAQEQIFVREQSLSDALPHNECITIRPTSYLDSGIVERCFAEIIRRHEIWRTTYDFVDGKPLQIVHDAPGQFPLTVIDLRAASEPEREARLRELYGHGARERFDLKTGPLLRVALVNVSNTDQRIVIFAHLSIIDGVSMYQILPRELSSLYEVFAAGRSPSPATPAIQYADFACWQRQWLSSPECAEQLNYWKQWLSDKPARLNWPVVSENAPANPHRGAIRSFALKPAIRDRLKEFSVSEGVTLFAAVTSGLTGLLYCYTGQNDITLGTPSLGARKRSELRPLLGHFLNPVPLRIRFEPNSSVRDLLLSVQQVIGGALAHDEVPIDMLARELHLTSQPSQSESFRVAISLQPTATSAVNGWQVTSMDADSGGTVWDLYLAFIETNDGIIGRAQYSTDAFPGEAISEVLEGIQTVLETMVAAPERLVSSLPAQLQSAGLLQVSVAGAS